MENSLDCNKNLTWSRTATGNVTEDSLTIKINVLTRLPVIYRAEDILINQSFFGLTNEEADEIVEQFLREAGDVSHEDVGYLVTPTFKYEDEPCEEPLVSRYFISPMSYKSAIQDSANEVYYFDVTEADIELLLRNRWFTSDEKLLSQYQNKYLHPKYTIQDIVNDPQVVMAREYAEFLWLLSHDYVMIIDFLERVMENHSQYSSLVSQQQALSIFKLLKPQFSEDQVSQIYQHWRSCRLETSQAIVREFQSIDYVPDDSRTSFQAFKPRVRQAGSISRRHRRPNKEQSRRVLRLAADVVELLSLLSNLIRHDDATMKENLLRSIEVKEATKLLLDPTYTSPWAESLDQVRSIVHSVTAPDSADQPLWMDENTADDDAIRLTEHKPLLSGYQYEACGRVEGDNSVNDRNVTGDQRVEGRAVRSYGCLGEARSWLEPEDESPRGPRKPWGLIERRKNYNDSDNDGPISNLDSFLLS